MPYIPKRDRKWVSENPEDIAEPGQLNYLINRLIIAYLFKSRSPTYQHYNDVIGVLECAKQEIYRRYITPYEEYKIASNGDVERDWEN